MSLNLNELDNLLPKSNGIGFTAACPACRERGMDASGNHLFLDSEGKGFGCIVNPGELGAAHRKRIFELVGEEMATPTHNKCRPPTSGPYAVPVPHYVANDKIPQLFTPTDAQLEMIATTRGWPILHALPAFRVLAARGLLYCGELFGVQSWIATDSTRFTWKARRLDGRKWQTQGGETKSIGVGKQLNSWPVGTDDIARSGCRFAVLCEGEPDMLAAATIAQAEGCDLSRIGFAALLGAAPEIDSRAVTEFKNKTVAVLRQNDVTHGKSATVTEKWCGQLHAVKAKLMITDFAKIIMPDGSPCKDVGDFAKLIGMPGLPLLFPDFPRVASWSQISKKGVQTEFNFGPS